MSCDAAASLAFLWLAATGPVHAPSLTLVAAAPASAVAQEPLFADIVKRAMLGIDADIRERGLGSRMLLQVHDELVLEVAPGELDELSTILTDRMTHAADLKVPLDVQLGTGANWDAAAH